MHFRCDISSISGVQLAGFTDLALRVVMRLAALDDTQSMTTRALADALDVKYTHATKAVAALHKLGVVHARRGRSGGLRLGRDAGQISVGALVREFEGGKEVIACEGGVPCPLRGGCRLRSALARAQEAFFTSLDPLTIADIASAPTRSLLLALGSPTAA